MKELKLAQQFVNQSNATNSNTDKLEVIKAFKDVPEVLQVLEYTYNTLKQYGVTSANCKKRSDLLGYSNTYSSLFTLLDDLNNRVCTGHDAIANVNRFVKENILYKDLIFNIIDRNLKTRSTVSMINKAIPNTVPTFDVALANAFDEKTKKKVDWNDGWMISRKLDGVRCITIIDDNGDVKFFSRAGKPFLTLSKIEDSIKSLGLRNSVLDGEVCILDERGDEDFTEIIKEIKRKDHTIENPFYWVFDTLSLTDFNKKQSDTTFNTRYENMLDIITPSKTVGILPQHVGNDDVFEFMMAESKAGGWEGLMLRKDEKYKGKRSNDILKVKQMFDEEFTVIDVENNLQRVIVNGKETEETMLKSVIIEYKGNKVNVGSGFTQEQRRHYFNNPSEIIGKTITVQYFETSKNQSGEHSLRFPVIKAIYENGRDF